MDHQANTPPTRPKTNNGSVMNAERPQRREIAALPTAIQTLAEDAGVPLSLYDGNGAIRGCSDAWQELISNGNSRAEIGQSISQLFTADIAEEILDVIQKVITSGQTSRKLGILRGRMMLITYRLLQSDEIAPDHQPLVLAVGRMVQSRNYYLKLLHDPMVRLCKANCAGRLSGLKLRQLEVLRMIGLGKSSAEMAKALHRTNKTIEFHRATLGQRLGMNNRIELAALAQRSGLVALENDEIADWWKRSMHDCIMQ